jgi:hypothetical protein
MGMIEYNGQNTFSDPDHATIKWNETTASVDPESSTVKELKDKYPEFKHL